MRYRSQTLLLRYATSMVGSIGSIFFLRFERRSDRSYSFWIQTLKSYIIFTNHIFKIFEILILKKKKKKWCKIHDTDCILKYEIFISSRGIPSQLGLNDANPNMLRYPTKKNKNGWLTCVKSVAVSHHHLKNKKKPLNSSGARSDR